MQPANNWNSTTSLSTPTSLDPTGHPMQLRKSNRQLPVLTGDDVTGLSHVLNQPTGVLSPLKSILNLFPTSSPPTQAPAGVQGVQPVNASALPLPPTLSPPPPTKPALSLQSIIVSQPSLAASWAPPSPKLAPGASNKGCPWAWGDNHNNVFNDSSDTSSNSSLDLEMANSFIPSAFFGLSTEDAAEFISDVENWFNFRKLSNAEVKCCFFYCSAKVLVFGSGK